jgi:hypothetical protein
MDSLKTPALLEVHESSNHFSLTRQTLLLVLVGLALRLFLIFPGPLASKVEFFTNWADLRNYYWPAQVVLKGENPYTLWANGQSGEFRADMAPLELAMYVATVRVWNDPRAIQLLFAIFDGMNIALLGVLLQRSVLRLPFQIFYALGPLTVYNLVLVSEDKTILLALTFLLYYLLLLPAETTWSSGRWHVRARTLVIPVAAILASFKWLSVFYLLPLLIFVSSDFRSFLKQCLVFGAVIGLSHVPWFPAWTFVYEFRLTRVAAPMHIAPAALLNAVGLYDKTLFLIVLAASLGLIYALFWFQRIDIFETIALTVMAGIFWTPDMDPVHLSVVVIGFLVIVDWARPARLVTVWTLSFWVAAVYALSTRTGFARYGLPDPRLVTGIYGSPQMILLSYPLFLTVFAFYVFDKWRGRAVGKLVLESEW